MNNHEPAFPQKEPLTSDSHGMTLRDYFAAKAMLGFITEPVEGVQEAMFSALSDNTCKVIAESSYAMADAMMVARDRA